jgi:hypothetical protein
MRLGGEYERSRAVLFMRPEGAYQLRMHMNVTNLIILRVKVVLRASNNGEHTTAEVNVDPAESANLAVSKSGIAERLEI